VAGENDFFGAAVMGVTADPPYVQSVR